MGYYKRLVTEEQERQLNEIRNDRRAEEEILQGLCTVEEESEYVRFLRNSRTLRKD